jgi:hypothetical protein
MGDRFGHQGKAQLQAAMKAKEQGADIAPVWNKSHREHTTIHSEPASVRAEADEAVKSLGWTGDYYVDADHIGLANVDLFMESSNFFTLDVAESIGKQPNDADLKVFMQQQQRFAGKLTIPGIDETFQVTAAMMDEIGHKYLSPVKEAARIYRHIEAAKGKENFVTEVSMDETSEPQTPIEMLFILHALAEEGIPAQTIAPRFSGRFNKGVDYVGEVSQFTREFENDLAVIQFSIKEFGLPSSLKLSVHSGSDKFAIYKSIREAIRKYDTGIHLKTAGTTWLEEVIGLAEAGGDGLEIAREVYEKALGRFDELCAPYAEVIDIDKSRLPSVEEVKGWDSHRYVSALRHDQSCPDFNLNFRQLIHVGYKVAAEMGERYQQALDAYSGIVGKCVGENLYERHLKPLFLD